MFIFLSFVIIFLLESIFFQGHIKSNKSLFSLSILFPAELLEKIILHLIHKSSKIGLVMSKFIKGDV